MNLLNIYVYLMTVVGATVLLILFVAYYYIRNARTNNVPQHPARPRLASGGPPGARRRQPRGLIQRPQARMRAVASEDSAPSDVDDSADDHEAVGGNHSPGVKEDDSKVPAEKKIGAKKSRKLAEKAERKEQREIEERQRAEKRKQDAEAERHRKIKEEEETKLAAELEVAELRARDEAAKREEHEYQRLKLEFCVEEEGTEAAESELNGTASQLHAFLNYIQTSKIVVLEDLCAKFDLKTQDCLDRIQRLRNEGLLSGVLDDRGKFVHLTATEYEAVAKFIRQRGRVTIAELVQNSTRLVKLMHKDS